MKVLFGKLIAVLGAGALVWCAMMKVQDIDMPVLTWVFLVGIWLMGAGIMLVQLGDVK